MVCKNCGYRIDAEGVKFCPKCGEVITLESQVDAITNTSSENNKKSSKKTIIIVSILIVVLLLIITVFLFRKPLLDLFDNKDEEITMAVTDSGDCGENVKWEYDETKGLLVIFGTGMMDDYDFDYESYTRNRPWEQYVDDIKEIIISDGVTVIGTDSFAICRNLVKLTISDSVTTIGSMAFNGCTALTSVAIPNSVTTIDSMAFSGCTALTNVAVPDSVTTIGRLAFNGCTALTSITVDVDNGCYSSVDGVLFNKEKSTLIKYPIGNKRTSYTIPDSVTSIENMAFSGCDSLTSLTIGDNVTTIGAFAFDDCANIKNIYYSGTETQWKSISIETPTDEGLSNATIHYNQ